MFNGIHTWGYDDFLDAVADPAHERHAEIREWAGEGFAPETADVERLAGDVAVLAKRWARKPPAKRAPGS